MEFHLSALGILPAQWTTEPLGGALRLRSAGRASRGQDECGQSKDECGARAEAKTGGPDRGWARQSLATSLSKASRRPCEGSGVRVTPAE